MNQHRGPAAIQGREQIRRIEEISAKYDSPNGGLAGIRQANAELIEQRDRARERQAG